MIGDKINIKDKYIDLANNVLDQLKQQGSEISEGMCIAVSGESGCGKSTLAFALRDCFENQGLKSYVFQMDDYFRLPPKSTHKARLENINNVGPHEVDLEKLDSHLREAKGRKNTIVKPLVDYHANMVGTETLDSKNFQLFIVEGTYCGLLSEANIKIFMSKNYIQTEEARLKRNRDPKSPFLKKVLRIEHQIISRHIEHADIIVDENNRVRQPRS